MKSSLEKFGRKLTMHKNDPKEKREHQPSALLDELIQASKDMQDIRHCYDGLISAAAGMTNSIFEFSESLREMGTCLLDTTDADDSESGRVLSTLGNIQSELQKIVDDYRSYVIVTITNPSESLLSELRKVEEMKLQCDVKREDYEDMMSQHKEKGKLSSGKGESSVSQDLQEAQDEYKEMARLCSFRVKSLKEGHCRSLLTQATRHHAAQLTFFRKGFKALEAVDPIIRIVAEKHRIDYQLTELDNGNAREGENMGSFERTDDGELSFDYGQKKQGIDSIATSSNQMEVDQPVIPHLRVPPLENQEQLLGRKSRVSSHSAPLYPEKQTRQKYHSYALPSPIDTKSPISKTPSSIPQNNPFSKLQHERDFSNNNTSTSTRSTIKDSSSSSSNNNINTSIQLPSPSGGRFSAFDNNNNSMKRQAYSSPLPPTKSFVSRDVSPPPPLSSPKISELHELPRPPPPSGLSVSKNQEVSPPLNKSPLSSPLPPPTLIVSRSFSVHSSGMVARSPRVHGSKREELSSPPLTPILLSNVKSTSRT